MNPITVIGEGGHSKVVQDIIKATGEYQIAAFLDDKYTKVSTKSEIVYAPVSYAIDLMQATKSIQFIIAIGNNRVRKHIADRLKSVGATFAVLIHPSAVISPSAIIKEGTVVMPNAVVNAESVVGHHVIINTAAVIEHDNCIGDYAHVSPGAILTGNVMVGEGTQIGAGTSVIPGKIIGSWTMVGAGSVVINDLPGEITAVGAPARAL